MLREQLRSPGQRLLGTITVDRRTGRRVALWRTLAVAGARAAAAELTRRLEPAQTPEREREREAANAEVAQIMRRHPQASPEREAELMAAYRRHSEVTPSLPRVLAPSLVAGAAERPPAPAPRPDRRGAGPRALTIGLESAGAP